MGGAHRHFNKTVPALAIVLLMAVPGRVAAASLSLSYSSMVLNTVQSLRNLTSQSLGVSAPTVTYYTASVSTTSGGNWLSISPGTGVLNTVTNSYLIVAADSTALGPGTYFGMVTVAAGGVTQTVQVILVVSNAASGGTAPIAASPSSVSLTAAPNASATSQVMLTTTSSSGLSYTLTGGTIPTGAHWLGGSASSLSLSSTSPSTLYVTANAAGLSAGTYYGLYQIWPGNGLAATTIPVTFTVTAAGTGNVTVTANNAPGLPSLAFAYVLGGFTPAVQTLEVVSASGSASVAFTVSSSATWLSAGVANSTSLTTPVNSPGLPISVNPSGLLASATPYSANITISPNGGTVVTVPVTLTVQPAPSVTVTPTALTFAYPMGAANPAPATINLSGGGQALGFTAQVTNGSNWLGVAPVSGTTPVTGTIALTVTATPREASLTANTYTGTILVSGTGIATNSTSITVTLSVTGSLPAISGVVNVASYAKGAIAAGEMVAIFGTAIGPATAAYASLDPSTGMLATTAGGVQVLFNGIPAPIYYAGSTQVNTMVPYEMAPVSNPSVWIKYLGQSSNAYPLNSTATAPGLFTLNSQGSGPGAILNQDNSVNGPANPAPKGSFVVVYLTGEGQTSPAGITGMITAANLPPPQVTPGPLLQVGVLIDGQPANGIYAGEAPGFAAGLMQLNVQIPAGARSGDLPIVVSIGGHDSQSGVTVSVR